MTGPDLLEGGRDRDPRLPPVLGRAAWGLLAVVAGGAVLASLPEVSSAPPPTQRPTASPTASADLSSVDRTDVQLRLSAVAQRDAYIRDVPKAFRNAAGLASATRGGRTPGNFFLAVAYARTLYGAVLVRTPGERFVVRGPVQWDPLEFQRYAEPGHRDISTVLDSFLAVDRAVHRGRTADFTHGAYGPARKLGMTTREARSVAAIYEILDGAGVQEGLPN